MFSAARAFDQNLNSWQIIDKNTSMSGMLCHASDSDQNIDGGRRGQSQHSQGGLSNGVFKRTPSMISP